MDLKKQRIQLTMKIGTSGKKETKEPEKKADVAEKGNETHNKNRNSGNKNKTGNKERNFKKGNSFFDGIVIK